MKQSVAEQEKSNTNNFGAVELPPPSESTVVAASAELTEPQVPSVLIPSADELSLPQSDDLLPEFDGTSMPGAWIELRSRQAKEPLHTSREYELGVEACKAEHEARRKSAWNPNLVAAIILLLVLGTILFVGCAK